jgi:hypothetical protein
MVKANVGNDKEVQATVRMRFVHEIDLMSRR